MAPRKVRVDDIGSPPGGLLSVAGVRDYIGTLFAAYHDSTVSPTRTRLYTSLDEGVTWSAETWSQKLGNGAADGDGGEKPILLVDQANSVWMVTSKWDGAGGSKDGPHFFKREPDRQRWGGEGLFQFFGRLSTEVVTPSGATMDAAIDPAAVYLGMPNVICVFQRNADAKIYIVEFKTGNAFPTNHKDLGLGTEPRVITGAGGYAAIAFRNSAQLRFSNRSAGQGIADWTGQINVHQGGDSVVSCEDIAIDQNGNPAILYRFDKGGTNVLKLVEVNPTLTYSEVTDGTDRNSFAGCSLQYDSRGSVYVIAIVDTGGANPVPVRYELLRPLGQTSWTMEAIESTATATSQDTVPIKSRVPSLINYHPMVMHQGAAAWYLKDNAELFWYVTDPYPGSGAYPTIFSSLAGEPPYRAADSNTRSSQVFTAEGSAATTFPSITPEVEMRISQEFRTDEARFEAPYVATIARFHTKRRSFHIKFVAVPAADKDTLVTFLEARMKDGGTFNWTIPEARADANLETLPVFISSGRFQHRKIGANIWNVGEFIFTESVTP